MGWGGGELWNWVFTAELQVNTHRRGKGVVLDFVFPVNCSPTMIMCEGVCVLGGGGADLELDFPKK